MYFRRPGWRVKRGDLYDCPRMSWLGYKRNWIKTRRVHCTRTRIRHHPQKGLSLEETSLSQSFLVARSQRKTSGRFLASSRRRPPSLTPHPPQARLPRRSTFTASPTWPRPRGLRAPGPPWLSCTSWDQIQVSSLSQIWKQVWPPRVLLRMLRSWMRIIRVHQPLKNVKT